jgi:hypothetical protein
MITYTPLSLHLAVERFGLVTQSAQVCTNQVRKLDGNGVIFTSMGGTFQWSCAVSNSGPTRTVKKRYWKRLGQSI